MYPLLFFPEGISKSYSLSLQMHPQDFQAEQAEVNICTNWSQPGNNSSRQKTGENPGENGWTAESEG